MLPAGRALVQLARKRVSVFRVVVLASILPISGRELAHFEIDSAEGTADNHAERCIQYKHFQSHSTWKAKTLSRQTFHHPERFGIPQQCGATLARNARQIWNYVTFYKNATATAASTAGAISTGPLIHPTALTPSSASG